MDTIILLAISLLAMATWTWVYLIVHGALYLLCGLEVPPVTKYGLIVAFGVEILWPITIPLRLIVRSMKRRKVIMLEVHP